MTGHLALVLFSLFVKVRITVELTWSTEKLSNTCCQSKNQLLMWNFTEGVNERIMELHWFFNDTTLICLDSKTIGFHVEALYDGRVERKGTAGILLRNVSLNDAGKYTLYVKLAEEKIRNVQNIFLTVDVAEQVLYQCKPIIEIHPSDVMFCSTTCLERSQLSPEWIINGSRDQVGIGRHLRINAEINEQAFCCLRGLKCHDDDQFNFCMPNPNPSKVLTSKEDIDTRRQNETNTVKVTNYDNDKTSNVMIILSAVMMAASFIVITIASFILRRHKSFDVKPQKSDTAKECTEELQQVETVAQTTVDVKRKKSNMAKECTEDLQQVETVAETTVDVKPKKSNTAKECIEDLQQVESVAESTDRSPHDLNSNQNIQILNNISMDAELLKCLVDSQRLFMTELEAVREETRKLKRLLSSHQHLKTLQMTPIDKSVETTQVISHYHNHNDTDTSETTSVYEDAVSEPLIQHDWSGSIHSYLHSGYSSSDEH